MISAGVLVLEGVSAGYGETVVLEGISLDLPPGQTFAVLGRNGVGKTTLLATIMGHTRLHRGSIRFAGREISALPSHRRARRGIAFVPQEREIFSSLTVEENRRAPGAVDSRRGLRLFPAARRTPAQLRQSAFGWGAADARDRPRADGQSEIAADG